MRTFARCLAASLLLTLAGHADSSPRPTHPAPVVVELFTAQGCVSCGAADPVFDHLADRPGVTALNYAVDYWDYLGWKDTFAKPEFADRQRAYDRRLGPMDVYTPQVIVGGRAQSPGDQSEDIDALLQKDATRAAASPAIAISGAQVSIAAGRAPVGGADVWLVRYMPGRQTVAIKDGDNRGKVLLRRNVVRQLVRLGRWTGARVRFETPPAPEAGLTTTILVQGRRGGPILSARSASAHDGA